MSVDNAGRPDATDETRLSPSGTGETRLSPSGSAATTSGWLTSSGSIDHGRFPPGTLLENRYRIIGLLGRGGMGEVYRGRRPAARPAGRAEVPAGEPRARSARLAQFHNEVRTARQVSHPNVCRVYDIGDAAGQLFLTMEYVDGEDLSSLLRRIGRLPEDKAVEIARQICAGLAAAHERGDHSPGSETGQHHARRRRPCPRHGLQPGVRGRRDRRRRRHARLHGAGATAGPRGQRAERHLRARARVLRTVHRDVARSTRRRSRISSRSTRRERSRRRHRSSRRWTSRSSG